MSLQKGHTSTKGNNPDLKNMCQLIYGDESIYEISKLHLYKFVTDGRTHTHRHAKNFNFSKLWGIKRAGCFAFIVLRMSCYCKYPVALPHRAIDWSAVCDCGIS